MQHALLILLLLAPSQGKDGKNVKDQKQIQGTWQLVSGERGGNPLPEAVVKTVTLVFKSDKLTTKVKDRANEATFKLRADTQPKEIDLDMDGNVGRGIYLLEGDTLKIAHGEVGEERPKGFPGKTGSGLTIMTLKRVKP